MHQCIKFISFGIAPTMFRTVFLSIVRSSRSYIVQQADTAVCLLARVFIHSLVFSLRGRAGWNQSPVMRPIWLWYTASWASSWGQFAIAFAHLQMFPLSPPGACTSATTQEILTAKGGTPNEINLRHWCIWLVLLQK